jgi:hypothetical protein
MILLTGALSYYAKHPSVTLYSIILLTVTNKLLYNEVVISREIEV